MATRTRAVNGVGIGMLGIKNEHIKDVRVYPENGSVQLWVDVGGREYLQYISPSDARLFAKAFKASAKEAEAQNK